MIDSFTENISLRSFKKLSNKIFLINICTGDDCVSIVNGSRNVVIRKITCGPGHGIRSNILTYFRKIIFKK